MILYHVGNYLYKHKIPLLPKIANALIRIIHNCAVFSETQIGKSTTFAYGGIGVVIHKKCVIGERCVIGQNVTIGGKSKHKSVPIIGDDCYIASGAKILGPITVGNNVVIGANAVVLKDIPDGCIVVGIPARIIKTGILSKDYY
ncbi:Serine acetyltransferase [compost metagenome]